MLLKLGKSFCKAGESSWAGGREGRRKWGSFTWFQVSGQNFCMSNSSQLQDPCGNIATRNPKYWVCMQDRSCQAEEWDFKAELKNRIMYLSLYRMCLLKSVGNMVLLITQIWPPFSLMVGEGRKALAAVEWQLFPPCF